jgi:hypothetical protein
MIPLNLSSREQEFLAELSALTGRIVYCYIAQGLDWPTQIELDLAELLERFNYEPSDMSKFYDKLHRTGANS